MVRRKCSEDSKPSGESFLTRKLAAKCGDLCLEGSALSWLGHDHGSLVQGLGSRNFIYSKHPVAFGNSFLDLQPCDTGCDSFLLVSMPLVRIHL